MADLYRSDITDVDLNKSLLRSYAGELLATGDKNANRFGVRIFRDGEAVNLSGCAVTGYFIRPNMDTVTITGTVSGNVAYVDLPQACYTTQGQFSLAIKVSGSGITDTVRIVDGFIRTTQTETMIDPGSVIPTLDELFAQIAAMEQATAGANTAAAAANEAREGIQGDLAALTEEIGAFKTEGGTEPVVWVRGGISSSDGANSSSTTRLRTAWYIPSGVVGLVPADGFKFIIFCYDNSGAYAGAWSGQELKKSATWFTAPVDISELKGQYIIRLVFAYDDDREIAVSAAENMRFNRVTDESLTTDGVAADAKAVGVYAQTLLDHGIVDLCKFSGAGQGKLNGVTCERNLDGTWTFSGTATGNVFLEIMKRHPITGGRVYHVGADSVNTRLFWEFSDGTSDVTLNISGSRYVKAPDNATSVSFGLRAWSGDTFDSVTVKPYFLTVRERENGEGVLFPTGDETDRTSDITFMLETFGECHLTAGDYYVQNVVIPAGGVVTGCGQQTRVHLLGDGEGSCFILNSRCTVKDMELLGSPDEIIPPPTADANRNGILFDGDLVDGVLMKGNISNVRAHDFAGGGIRMQNTGISSMGGLNVSDCDIERCYAGIYIAQRSEFHRITNVSMTQNRYGTINNGGNNQYSCCGFNSNINNFVIKNDDGTKYNNGHGAAVGCNMHHANSKAIRVIGMTSGFIFSGCNIDEGGALIKDSSRIIFSGCNFMNSFSLTVDGKGTYSSSGETEDQGNLVIFNGCSFRKTFESVTLENGAERSGIKFDGCYYEDGAAVNPS